MTPEIQLVQLPIINHTLSEIGMSVTQRLEILNIDNLVATEDTVKTLKMLRAELNSELQNFEAQRKAVKEGVLNPYSEFEAIYKTEISEKYKSAVDKLKDKIAFVENKIKSERKEYLVNLFNELCQSYDIDFLKFEHTGIEVNLSTSGKQYKERITEFVEKVNDDLTLISTHEFQSEILVEYKKTLNASKAIKEVFDRKRAEREEADRIHFQEIQRRESKLRSLAMVFIGITNTYEFDAEIYISKDAVENLEPDMFEKAFIELSEKIKAKQEEKRKEIEASTPKPETQPLPRAMEAPLQAPVVEKQEPILTASFECQGTRAQLLALGEYMKQNGITYKNI